MTTPPQPPQEPTDPDRWSSPSGEQGASWSQYDPEQPPPPPVGSPFPAAQAYQAGYYGGYGVTHAHSNANVAMGLGITSLVCAVLTPFCCITIPGILAGPFAIVLGVTSRRQISQSPGLYNNHGAALTGLITGIIGTVLGALMVVGVFLIFGLAASMP